MQRTFFRAGLLLVATAVLSGCTFFDGNTTDSSNQETSPLIVYSGRGEDLVGPLLEQFTAETGIETEIKYAGSAELATTILQEGENSPADLFFSQDAGALGALAAADRLTRLPEDTLSQVPAAFRSADNAWVGTSGRARTIVYNTDNLTPEQLPEDIFGFCDESWQGRLGWAPTNGSFQAFVTALRLTEGEERARAWIECIRDNDTLVYSGNTPIVAAVGSGEIDAGFVNHYYLYRFYAEEGNDYPAANYHPRSGDIGGMVNVAGVGVLNSSSRQDDALRLVSYLLSAEAQQYFADETFEYPLVEGIATDQRMTPLAEINAPALDLSRLEDLQATLQLLTETGALE